MKEALARVAKERKEAAEKAAAKKPKLLPAYRPRTGFWGHDTAKQKARKEDINETWRRTLFEIIHRRPPTRAEVLESRQRAKSFSQLRRYHRKLIALSS